MRRSIRFFLHSTIAIFVVLVNTFMFQLIFHAPMPVGGRVAGLQIRSLFIPGQALTCTPRESQDHCQITLFDRPLEVRMSPFRSEFKQCRISYAGQTAKCNGDFHSLIIGAWMPVITTESNLGLNANQIETLKERYPQRNFFLDNVGEPRLLQIATGIAIAAGILTFLFGWLHFAEVRLFLAFGFVVFILTWIISNAMLWGLGYVD